MSRLSQHLIIGFLFFVSLAANCFARMTRAEALAVVMREIASADAIEVDDISTVVTVREGIMKDGVMVFRDLPPPIRHLRFTTKEDLVRLIGMLKFTEKYLRPAETIVTTDGKTETIYPLCQCLGDFELRFFHNHKELLTCKLYHEGSFAYFQLPDGIYDFDFLQPSGAELQKTIEQSFAKVHAAQYTRKGTPQGVRP